MAAQTSGKSGFLGWYFGSNLLVRIMIGLLLGAIVGIALAFSDPGTAQTFVGYTKFLGDIFIRLLQMIVVPVIFLSLIAGAASIAPAELGRVGAKTLLYYLILVIVAITIGLVLANIFKPGDGLNLTGAADLQGKASNAPPLSTVLLAIIPTNIIDSLAKAAVLPIIFFALCFGVGLSYLRDSKDADLSRKGAMLFDIISAGAEVMYKIVRGIMEYAPIGVFFLIAGVFAVQGPKVIGPLVFVMALAYVGYIIHVIVGFGGSLTLFGLNFITFLRGAQEAMITAFVTRSSNATLPISLRVSEENLGVPRSISSFTLPIGATINMDGTAIYLAIGSMFIGFAVGKPLSMDQQLVVMITATLGAIGAAGVPGAGALMMLLVLESVGLKVEAGTAVAAAYAMILGVDTVFDMGRTCLNVTGDIVAATVVSKTEGELDMSKWKKA
ncbi:Sodium:dicarboxylate symporter [uncultured delta proteobacterium]|uniref:Sodium:dicarboxylate symporter n=1 Tax=uncultured delta proteobacterium TaxID=34034 RepID=A0A212KCZ4_9DELT|nr:Sodium:dicarboxylate symporter [uncultured delta proteobacterium]